MNIEKRSFENQTKNCIEKASNIWQRRNITTNVHSRTYSLSRNHSKNFNKKQKNGKLLRGYCDGTASGCRGGGTKTSRFSLHSSITRLNGWGWLPLLSILILSSYWAILSHLSDVTTSSPRTHPKTRHPLYRVPNAPNEYIARILDLARILHKCIRAQLFMLYYTAVVYDNDSDNSS